MIQYRWVILGLVIFCQLTQAISFQGIPPILGLLVQGMHFSYAQAGGLMSLFSMPRIFVGLISGVVVDRYGTKKIGCVSLLALAMGTAMVAAGNSYWVLGLGRLLAGVGTTFLLVVTLHAVTSWFREGEKGLSMGVFHTAMPLGTILSLNFVGVYASQFGWRAPMWVISFICLAAFLLFTMFYRERPFDVNERREPLNIIRILKKAGWAIWLVGASWALLNASIIPYFTYAPDYFITQGKELGEAGLLASFPMWGSIFLAPFVGLLIDRAGKKRLLILLSFAFGAILYYLIPRFSQYAGVAAISLGVFAAIQPTAIFSLAAELLPPSVMGVGFGILGTLGAIGMALGPYVAGTLRDLTGNYLWSFNAMAILSALGVLPALLVKGPPVKKSKSVN